MVIFSDAAVCGLKLRFLAAICWRPLIEKAKHQRLQWRTEICEPWHNEVGRIMHQLAEYAEGLCSVFDCPLAWNRFTSFYIGMSAVACCSFFGPYSIRRYIILCRDINIIYIYYYYIIIQVIKYRYYIIPGISWDTITSSTAQRRHGLRGVLRTSAHSSCDTGSGGSGSSSKS